MPSSWKATCMFVTLASSLFLLTGTGCSMQLGLAPGAITGTLNAGAAAQSPQSAPLPPGWRLHEDPAGFAVQVPQGWKVSKGDSGAIVFTGPDGVKASARTFSSDKPLTAAGARELVNRLAKAAAPGFTWEAPLAVGGSAIKQAGKKGGTRTVASVAWSARNAGSAGAFYQLEAPSAGYQAAAETFGRVLSSFGPGTDPTGANAAKPANPATATSAGSTRKSYTTWRDPRESAFSVEIPAGWKAEGGTVRPSTLLVQGSVEATSPDGAITLFIGDTFPVYVEPSAVLAMAGIGEGGSYPDGYGYTWQVARYLPGGAAFERTVLPALGDAKVLSRRDRDDVTAGQATGPASYTAGEVTYMVNRDGRDRRGGALTITERVDTGSSSVWHIKRLFGYEAPADRAAEAAAALDHMAATFRIDPDWQARQDRTTAEQSRIIAKSALDIFGIVRDTYQNKQAVDDDLSRKRSNSTLGLVDLQDAATGTTYKASDTSNYYWVDARGTIVGTRTGTAPSGDFRELLQLP